MGRAPEAHIMKKLMRRYFKFDLKKTSFNTAGAYYPTLLNTWAKKGMDSIESSLVQEKIDTAMANDEREFREIKTMTKRYPYDLNQMLPKIKNKYAYKGRNKQYGADYNDTTEASLNFYNKSVGLK